METSFMRDAEFCDFVTKILLSIFCDGGLEKTGFYCIFSQIEPQGRSMLKAKIYENNWSAKNRHQLIRKIRKCTKEFDIEPIDV